MNDIPKGFKIQEIEGTGKLQSLLTKLKNHSFTGYIRFIVPEQFEGLIVIKKGIPVVSQLETPSEKIVGLESLQRIQSLGHKAGLIIQVYTKVDIDQLISELDGKIPGEERVDGEKVGQDKQVDISIKIMDGEIGPQKSSKIAEKIDDKFPTRYSFEKFIVGPNNRFAYAASMAVSGNPEKSYNPLLIKAESGLGKTHLMKAIGRALSKKFPNRNIRYVETSKLISGFNNNLENDNLKKFEKEYIECDTLLLDDIQYIAERLDVQHSLYRIFNKIQNKNGQIIISSDRPPENITEIEERLASGFKSGLVVDILPPIYETRKQIIKEKSKQFSFEISPEVLDFIARNIKKNVRFIEGALTRVSAYSDLLDEEITLDNVKKTLEQYIDKEIEHEELKLEVMEGRSYLIKGDSVENVFELLKRIDNENERFVISRLNPTRIEDEFNLEDSEVKWLTDKESEETETISPNLERLSWLLEKKSKEDSVILLDGLEYLISNVNFEAALKFIRHMVDIVSETESIFLVIVNPNALEEKEVSVLEREMDTISYVS